MASSTAGRSGPLADINVTPLVDVMLVLLIIFIVTAPIVARPISVALPQRVDRPIDRPLVEDAQSPGQPLGRPHDNPPVNLINKKPVERDQIGPWKLFGNSPRRAAAKQVKVPGQQKTDQPHRGSHQHHRG